MGNVEDLLSSLCFLSLERFGLSDDDTIETCPMLMLLTPKKVNNPLNASPANHEISHTDQAGDHGAGNASGGQVSKNRRTQGSGGSGAPKSGGGKYGGGGSGA